MPYPLTFISPSPEFGYIFLASLIKANIKTPARVFPDRIDLELSSCLRTGETDKFLFGILLPAYNTSSDRDMFVIFFHLNFF